ncbi:MAG: L-ribulose-5-phosphate 4-epimerase AraD [Planctomycetes bacterium]|nr:L-ribulose-5-phosphate 4-epimerase AraD [Planctomycetota bacterium]
MTDLSALRERVFRANLDLVTNGLVLLTWGNASAVDRAAGVMLIKPSGVDYTAMTAADLVAVRLADGEVLADPAARSLKPSSDTATHLALYRAWPGVGGIVHTHSEYATATAQAGCGIAALGTTHADYFHGDVPCTRALTAAEIDAGYEAATGAVIVERFAHDRLDPLAMPGTLIAQHGPFAWGVTVEKAVYHATVLERLARMAVHTRTLNPQAARVPQHLLDKHYRRKHGPDAYYGQR